MPEISRKVTPYEYNYLCDGCKGGMMVSVGDRTESGYPHKCVICSHKTDLKAQYPHIEYYGDDEQPRG